jgi:hypothetical protein
LAQISGMLCAALARHFFFDFAGLAVDLVARGFGKEIEKCLEAFGLAKFAGEGRMGMEGETISRMVGIGRISTESG